MELRPHFPWLRGNNNNLDSLCRNKIKSHFSERFVNFERCLGNGKHLLEVEVELHAARGTSQEVACVLRGNCVASIMGE